MCQITLPNICALKKVITVAKIYRPPINPGRRQKPKNGRRKPGQKPIDRKPKK